MTSNGTGPCVRRCCVQELVNRRQGGMRTIITTNLSRRQMTTAYDERTIDRLRHGGVMVSLRGESMRGGGHAGK